MAQAKCSREHSTATMKVYPVPKWHTTCIVAKDAINKSEENQYMRPGNVRSSHCRMAINFACNVALEIQTERHPLLPLITLLGKRLHILKDLVFSRGTQMQERRKTQVITIEMGSI